MAFWDNGRQWPTGSNGPSESNRGKSGNSIDSFNKQIEINSHFNDSIIHLKLAIEADRKELNRAYVELSENEKRFILQQLKLNQIMKLKMLEGQINQIIDNTALMKHGLVHPCMLTATEINETKLDFYKLKNVRVGLQRHEEEILILAIKIFI